MIDKASSETTHVLSPDFIGIALRTLDGKWTPFILVSLKNRPLRHTHLGEAMPGISRKVLTQQLRALEKEGLVRREAYLEVPPYVAYRLTPYGFTLLPALEALSVWGKGHLARGERKEAVHHNRKALSPLPQPRKKKSSPPGPS